MQIDSKCPLTTGVVGGILTVVTTAVVDVEGARVLPMKKPPLGELELEVLRFIAGHAPLSVGEVMKRFGEERGLARTTILTVMGRLREKGYLTRSPVNGLFRYTTAVATTELLRGLVENFVEKTLGGSLSPFVAYITETKNLTKEEVAELTRLVQDLEN